MDYLAGNVQLVIAIFVLYFNMNLSHYLSNIFNSIYIIAL